MLRRRITIVPLVASLALLMASLISSAEAAEQGAAPVEGESFTKPPGTQVVLGDQYSGGKALKISSSQTVPTKQVTITETSNVLVRARAGQTGGSPTLTIRVDGENAGKRTITSNVLSNYLYSGITLEAGTYKIGLKGGNIAQSRYVFVDVVKFPSVAPPLDTTAPEIQITQGPAEGSVSSEGRFFISSNEPVQFYYDIRWATYTGQPTYQVLGNPNSTEVDIAFNLSSVEGKEMVLYIKAVDAASNATEIQRRWTVARTIPVVVASSDPTGHGGAGVSSQGLIQSFTPAQDTLLYGLDLSLCRTGTETVTTSVQVTLYERTSTGSVQQIAGPREVEWTATGGCSSPDVPVDYSAQNIQLEAGHEYGIGVVSGDTGDTAVYWEGGSAYSGGTVYSGTANFSSGTPAYPEGLDVGFKVYGR